MIANLMLLLYNDYLQSTFALIKAEKKNKSIRNIIGGISGINILLSTIINGSKYLKGIFINKKLNSRNNLQKLISFQCANDYCFKQLYM